MAIISINGYFLLFDFFNVISVAIATFSNESILEIVPDVKDHEYK